MFFNLRICSKEKTPLFYPGYAWLLALCFLNSAKAGTYNFYFNNSEQGDHGTANPSVTVNGPKTEKNEENQKGNSLEKAESDHSSPNQPSPSTSPIPSPGVEEKKPLVEPDDSGRMVQLRLSGGLTYIWGHSTRSAEIFEADMKSRVPFWEQKIQESEASIGGYFAGSLLFFDQLGATAFLGSLSGLELEWTPFGYKGVVLQPGIVMGHHRKNEWLLSDSASQFFAGAKLGIQVSKRVGLAFTYRHGLGDVANSGLNLNQLDAGLSLYF